MIDLHSHILPGIDDGAVDLSASLALARGYVAAGFEMVVATPHALSADLSPRFAGLVARAVDRLNRALQAHAITIRVLPGMEVEMDARLPAHVTDGAAIPLAGKDHLLVETPFLRMPLGWQNMVYDLGNMGITVVFAHPERSVHLQEKPSLLDEMAASGARLQVNWSSLAGHHGRTAKGLVRHMARRGLIHCMATDSHDPVHRHPGLAVEVAGQLADLVGTENLERIILKNPLQAVNGLPMQVPDGTIVPPRIRKKRSWWGRCLGLR